MLCTYIISVFNGTFQSAARLAVVAGVLAVPVHAQACGEPAEATGATSISTKKCDAGSRGASGSSWWHHHSRSVPLNTLLI